MGKTSEQFFEEACHPKKEFNISSIFILHVICNCHAKLSTIYPYINVFQIRFFIQSRHKGIQISLNSIQFHNVTADI